MNETIRMYQDMTLQEQLKFVEQFAAFADGDVAVLMALRPGEWTTDHRAKMERGLQMMLALGVGTDFARDGLRYGDYPQRTYRLPICVQVMKDKLMEQLNVTDQNGQRVVLVDPTVPARRRGRPSREEVAARKRGETLVLPDKGQELPKRIAQLLGLNVVITNNAPRELNNDELAVIRQKKQEEYDRQNPSLFATKSDTKQPPTLGDQADQGPARQPAGAATDILPGSSAAESGSNIQPDYGTGIETLADTRLHLDQLKPLLTKDLQMQVEQVRVLRQRAATAAETAKAMALRGEQPEAVEPYAQEAADCTEQYEAIYDAVDRELGTVWFRLQNDGEFRDRFQQHHRIKDLTAIAKQLKPYYQKVSSPEFDASVQRIIEQESPAYVAKVKAEQEKKEEVQGILRYLKRTDKPNALTRRNTARERFARLQQLLGEQESEYYRPYLTKIEEDYDQNFRPADEAKAETEKQAKEEKEKATKQESKKASKKK